VDAVVHTVHVIVIRCDIKPESVEKSRDGTNGDISEETQRDDNLYVDTLFVNYKNQLKEGQSKFD
jgi:hypothetical protein